MDGGRGMCGRRTALVGYLGTGDGNRCYRSARPRSGQLIRPYGTRHQGLAHETRGDHSLHCHLHGSAALAACHLARCAISQLSHALSCTTKPGANYLRWMINALLIQALSHQPPMTRHV